MLTSPDEKAPGGNRGIDDACPEIATLPRHGAQGESRCKLHSPNQGRAFISLCVRLRYDPKLRTSASGRKWASTWVAVPLVKRLDGEGLLPPPSINFCIKAFDEMAVELAQYAKGDLLTVSGRLTWDRWVDRSGSLKEGWQVVIDLIDAGDWLRGNDHG